MVRFWSYIFTPLLILVIIFSMFVIFTLSSAQTTVGSLVAPALAITSTVAANVASAATTVAANVASAATTVASAASAASKVSFPPTSVGTGP